MSSREQIAPFYRPSGMNSEALSDAPFELIVNLGIHEDGWRNFPGFQVRGNIASTGYRTKGGISASVAGRPRLAFLNHAAETNTSSLVLVDEAGAAETIRYWGGELNWTGTEWMSMAALNGRVFWSNSRYAVYACGFALDNEIEFGASNPNWTRAGRIVWRTGVAAAAYPYVTGAFGGKLLCAHLGYLFFAGFDQGQIVTLDAPMSEEQRYIAQDLVTSNAAILSLTPQTLVWSDPDDPFAIGLPNFSLVQAAGPITALASYKDALFVFTANEIWIMAGVTPQEFVLRRISLGVGCSDPRSLVVTPDGIYFGNGNGIYRTDGKDVELLSEPLNPFFEPGAVPPVAVSQIFAPFQLRREYGPAFFWGQRQEIWFPLRSVGTTMHRHCAVWNTRFREWSLATCMYEVLDAAAQYDFSGGMYQIGKKVYQVGLCREGTTVPHRLLERRGAWVGNGIDDITVADAQYYYLLTKPLAWQAAQETYAYGVDLVWRKAPNGMYSAVGVNDFNTVHVFGEETGYQQGAVSNSARTNFPQDPPMVSDANKAGKAGSGGKTLDGKWGSLIMMRHAEHHVSAPLDVRSRSQRIAVFARSNKPVHLRGVNLLYRTMGRPGGRE